MQQNKSNPSNASGAKWQIPTAAIISGTIILLLAVYSYKQVQAASYSRLAPIGVTFEFNYQNDQVPENRVVLEYDYGYGFIPAHRQSQLIQSQPDSQLVEFSIPSWKRTSIARLNVKERQGLEPKLVTFSKLDESVSVEPNNNNQDWIVNLDDLSKRLLESPIAPAIAKVNE